MWMDEWITPHASSQSLFRVIIMSDENLLHIFIIQLCDVLFYQRIQSELNMNIIIFFSTGKLQKAEYILSSLINSSGATGRTHELASMMYTEHNNMNATISSWSIRIIHPSDRCGKSGCWLNNMIIAYRCHMIWGSVHQLVCQLHQSSPKHSPVNVMFNLLPNCPQRCWVFLEISKARDL